MDSFQTLLQDLLFVTEKTDIDEPLPRIFAGVREEPLLVIQHESQPLRHVRFLRLVRLTTILV